MNALDDGSGNHFYFCQFANAASFPPEPLTSETSLSIERRKSSWIGSASVLGMRTLRQEKVGDLQQRPRQCHLALCRIKIRASGRICDASR